jgi:hypothetical protein
MIIGLNYYKRGINFIIRYDSSHPFPLPSRGERGRVRGKEESSKKQLYALSITQILRDDYADSRDFSMCLVSV